MFLLKFGDQIRQVHKIEAEEFTSYHQRVLSQITFLDGNLLLLDERWSTLYLGSGEEKAVYCMCDHNNGVFALEVIDERHYLNGRFIGGKYFSSQRVQGLANIKLNPDALIGLTFTGLVKVREYVHGYEWGCFRFSWE